jgi:mono/diheme cytochrome c family protein
MRALLALVLLISFWPGCGGKRTVESLTENSPADTARRISQSSAAQPVSPAEDGRSIFVANCLGCHGKNADGNTPAGRAWRVPDFRSQTVQANSDARLLSIIREGKGKMPAWGQLLSQTEIEHLLAYVRSLGGSKQ